MTFPFLAGETPGAGKFGEGPKTYTPALTADTTNPNLGANGEAVGWWVRVGPNTIRGGARFAITGTGESMGSGNLAISLPLAADTSILETSGSLTTATKIGDGVVRSATSGTVTLVAALLNSSTTVRMYRTGNSSPITNASPFDGTFPARLWVDFCYVIASGT